MSLEWIVTGIILLGGMAAGGASLWKKKRKESQAISDSFIDKSDLGSFENNKK